MTAATEDVISDQAVGTDAVATPTPSTSAGSGTSLAGASPAVPRDPRLLKAEAADFEARSAAEQAEAAKAAAADAEARAAAAREAAAHSKAELEAAREAAKAKAEAVALQVKLEQQQEADAVASARAQNRARRSEQLGTVDPVPEVEPQIVTITNRSTDKFAGALGLFLVRLVLAGWTGIVGYQSLIDRQATLDAMIKVGLPQATSESLVWLVGVGLIVIAAFLLFGVATRIFAAIMLVGTGVFLAFFRFGAFSPFLENHFGFYGDRDVFIAVLCLLLVLVGGGGWALDARVRHRRANAKRVVEA